MSGAKMVAYSWLFRNKEACDYLGFLVGIKVEEDI